MCDEAGGNAHWQFLSCLFLCHTHTKQRPLDSHNLHHLQCVSMYQLPVGRPTPPPPTPSPTPLQCKLKALLATQHICSSLPWESSPAYVQLGIRDLRSECHMNTAPCFWSARRDGERWVGGCRGATRTFIPLKVLPHNKRASTSLVHFEALHWNVSVPLVNHAVFFNDWHFVARRSVKLAWKCAWASKLMCAMFFFFCGLGFTSYAAREGAFSFCSESEKAWGKSK